MITCCDHHHEQQLSAGDTCDEEPAEPAATSSSSVFPKSDSIKPRTAAEQLSYVSLSALICLMPSGIGVGHCGKTILLHTFHHLLVPNADRYDNTSVTTEYSCKFG